MIYIGFLIYSLPEGSSEGRDLWPIVNIMVLLPGEAGK